MVARLDPAAASLPFLDLEYGRLPHQFAPKQGLGPVAELPGPSAQDVSVGVIFHVNDAPDMHGLHDIGIAQDAKRRDEPLALGRIRQSPRFSERDIEFAGFDGIDERLGMRRRDELGARAGGRGPQFVMDRILEQDVQMRVRFVQEEDRARAGMEERQEHQRLQRPAAGGCDVQRPFVGPGGEFGEYVRSAGVRRQQVVAEQLLHGGADRLPDGFVAVRFRQEIAHDLARPSETEHLLDLRPLQQRLVQGETAHGRHENDRQVEGTQGLGVGVRLGADIDLFGAVRPQLHRDRPARGVAKFDLDRVPVAPFPPEELECSERDGNESLPGQRRPLVPLARVEVVEFPPTLEGEAPRRDRLEHGRLAGVVRAGEHDVAG